METPRVESRATILKEAHLRDYWKIVWQGRWTVAAVFLLVVGATAVWSFMQTPVFRATAIVEVQPQGRQLAAGQDVSGLGAAGYGWFAEEKYHNTQVEIIRSRDVARRVVERLALASHPDFEEIHDPVDNLRKRIRVDPRRDTGLIEISISGSNPDEITQWVNTVADVYVRRNLEKARQNMQESIEAIEEQLDLFQASVEEAEEARILALSDNAIYDRDNQEEILLGRLKMFNTELTEVSIEKNRIQQTLDQIERLRARNGDLLSLPELADDDTLKELARQRVDLERQLESAKVEYRPGHPQYEGLVSQLSKVDQSIQDRIALTLGGLENKLQAKEQHESYLRDQIHKAEEWSLQVVRATSKYEAVDTNAEAKKTVVELINSAMHEVTLGAHLMNNNVSLLDAATPPRFAVKPRKKLNVMMGAFFGLFLGIAVVFFMDYLDNTFRTPEDLEKYLGLAVLGVIPRLTDEGMANRGVKEAYQSLRTSIIFSSKNRKRKVILITSTGPQEGKSSTVANLGRTLAQTGDRVIVIDCDLRRPTQHNQLEAEREHGLTNYLAAPADSTDWRIYTKMASPQNLHVLTCGPIPPSPPELLGSERFSNLLTALRDNYDWILLDSPPASSLADAPLLAQLADMVVLVVQHNSTDRDLASKSVQRIRAVDSQIAGAVLNNVDLARAYNKDYYYAGYYYYSEDEKAKKSTKKKPPVETEASVG